MAGDDQSDPPNERPLDGAPPRGDRPPAAGDDPRVAPGSTGAPGAPPSAVALGDARRAIEAVCMVSADPVPVGQLAQLLELAPDTVATLCRDLARSYRQEQRGFTFVEVAGGWRYQSHPDQAPYIERYVLEGQSARLSPAALETLAIVAYKQPLSRAQVSAIRGVNVDGVLRTLVNRGYVTEVGRDTGPGQAVLYGTTPLFLEKLGLAGLHELPPLGDFVPGAHVVEALEQTLRAGPAADDTAVADDDGRAGDPVPDPGGADGEGPEGDEPAQDLTGGGEHGGGDGGHG